MPISFTTIPAAPTGLYVNEITQTSAMLNWNVSTGATWYKVYLPNGTTVYDTRIVGEPDSTKCWIGHTPLSSNTSYTYYVSAGNSTGESGKLAVSFTTLLYPPALPVIKTTSPASGSTFQINDTITISATGASVTRWELWVDGTLKHNVNGDSFSIPYTFHNSGTYNVEFKAFNSANAMTSKTGTVYVSAPVPVTHVKFYSPTAKTVIKGKTRQLEVLVAPNNATNKTITWSSSDTNVATVDSTGKVTGRNVGTTTITAKSHNNITATCTVKVTETVYLATLNSYYDLGYPTYYSEGNDVSENRINGYMVAVRDRYDELFNLKLSVPHTKYYYSGIDGCKGTVSSKNINTLCSHNNPHTSAAGNFDDNPNSIAQCFVRDIGYSTDKITNAYWSTHKIKTDTSDNRSFSWGINGVYIINRYQINRHRRSEVVLMHEMNHQFGVRDHYHEAPGDIYTCKRAIANQGNGFCSLPKCNEKNGTIYRPASCIMNKSEQNIWNDDIMCGGCQEEIMSHLENHHK